MSLTAIRNLISYKRTHITMATLMTSWTNWQWNWLLIYGHSLCKTSYRLCTQTRRTATATKDVSTDTRNLLPAIWYAP